MVREIKFRAWFTDGKHTTMSGQVCSMMGDRSLREFLTDIENCAEEHGYEYTLMQFTGLKDKNGTEMYEGDILRVIEDGEERGELTEVKFECSGYFTKAWSDEVDLIPLRWGVSHGYLEYEIIGNIHENQDLMPGDSK